MIAFVEPHPLNGIERGLGDVKAKPRFLVSVSPRHLHVVSIEERGAIGETIGRVSHRNIELHHGSSGFRSRSSRVRSLPVSGNGFEEDEGKIVVPDQGEGRSLPFCGRSDRVS